MSIEGCINILISLASPIAGLCVRFSMLTAKLQRHLYWEWSQTTQPQQVVGRPHEVSVQLHAGNAAEALSNSEAG